MSNNPSNDTKSEKKFVTIKNNRYKTNAYRKNFRQAKFPFDHA
jgi:hypothetical protein